MRVRNLLIGALALGWYAASGVASASVMLAAADIPSAPPVAILPELPQVPFQPNHPEPTITTYALILTQDFFPVSEVVIESPPVFLVERITPASVPEPSTLFLWASVLLSFVGLRRLTDFRN